MFKKDIRERLEQLLDNSTLQLPDRKTKNKELAERYFTYRQYAQTGGLSPLKWRIVSAISSFVFLAALSVMFFMQPANRNLIYNDDEKLTYYAYIESESFPDTLISVKTSVGEWELTKVSVYRNVNTNEDKINELYYNKEYSDDTVVIAVTTDIEKYNNYIKEYVSLDSEREYAGRMFEYRINRINAPNTFLSMQSGKYTVYASYPDSSFEKAADFVMEVTVP